MFWCEFRGSATHTDAPRHVERRIVLEGPLTEEQRLCLPQVADRCQAKQTLERSVRVVMATEVGG